MPDILHRCRMLCLLLVIGLLLAACTAAPVTSDAPAADAESAAAAAEEASADGSTLTVAVTTFPNSIYMPQAAERNAANVAWSLYDSLVFVGPDGAVEPALAESWEISDDGATYTFTLREDVTFHNGEPFNADAVVFSWEQGKMPENEWFSLWENATSVTAIDEYTVEITTEGPRPLFLREMAQNWAMIPPGYFQEVGLEGFLQEPVGTGAFQLVEWIQGDRIVMEAFEEYWREGYPLIDNLIFRPIPESSTRVAAIQTGEVDIVTRLSAEEAASLEGTEDVEVVNYPVNRSYYIAFNNLTTGVGEPTEDPLVRRAMNYAVDVDAIIDALFNGYAAAATGLVTPGDWGYDETLEPFGYDPERARELLDEAGYPDGFSMGFACPIGAYTNFEQVCEAVQGYLMEVGIETELELMESGAYWDLEAAKELPPLFGDSWSAVEGEALARLNGSLRGFDASYSAWEDPVITELLQQIESTVDETARADLYVELQHYMQENPPFIYLYEPVTFEAYRTRVENFQPNPSEQYFLYNVSVSD